MRTWVYQTLKLSAIWAALEGRLYQGSRMTKVPDNPLHAFYRIGVTTGRLHTSAPARVTPFQLFVHDVPGDYMQIDDLLELAKESLTLVPLLVPEPKLICCEWLDHSQDIPEDPLTGTISKFSRYSLVHRS